MDRGIGYCFESLKEARGFVSSSLAKYIAVEFGANFTLVEQVQCPFDGNHEALIELVCKRKALSKLTKLDFSEIVPACDPTPNLGMPLFSDKSQSHLLKFVLSGKKAILRITIVNDGEAAEIERVLWSSNVVKLKEMMERTTKTRFYLLRGAADCIFITVIARLHKSSSRSLQSSEEKLKEVTREGIIGRIKYVRDSFIFLIKLNLIKLNLIRALRSIPGGLRISYQLWFKGTVDQDQLDQAVQFLLDTSIKEKSHEARDALRLYPGLPITAGWAPVDQTAELELVNVEFGPAPRPPLAQGVIE